MEFIKKKKEDLSIFDNNEIATYNIEIILTEKCNLNCAHCMRGNSTNKEIKPEVLDKLFTKFPYIHALSLGGGEISLTPHLIRLLTQKLKQYGTIVHRIDFTSNGMFVSNEFLEALNELRDYVLSCKNSISLVEIDEKDNEPLIACFSFDDFHIQSIKDKGKDYKDIFNNIIQYKNYFGENAIECRLSSDVDIINAGRAKSLKTYIKKIKPIKPTEYLFPYQIESDYIFMGGILTVSCDGEFVPVNIPFSEEKLYSYGNILTDKFSTIVSRMNVTKAKNTDDLNYLNMKNINMMIAPKWRWNKYLKSYGNKKFALFDYMLKQNEKEN